MDTNDSLRVASLWHSMHAISQQLSPISGCSGTELLEADTFDLHCFQSLTGTFFLPLLCLICALNAWILSQTMFQRHAIKFLMWMHNWSSRNLIDILWDPISVGERNETLLIRVWKPLPSRHIQSLERKPEKENPKRTISASGGLELIQRILESYTG